MSGKIIKALFIDECSPNQQFGNLFQSSHYCWVAPSAEAQELINASKDVNITQFRGFQFLRLSTNLRNSKEIVNRAKTVAEEEKDEERYERNSMTKVWDLCWVSDEVSKDIHTFAHILYIIYLEVSLSFQRTKWNFWKTLVRKWCGFENFWK